MDPNRWVDLLFTYGPYAILVLFVLFVAPMQTKTFGSCPKQDKAQRFLCGSVAVGCWIVVVLMVWVIYRDWPPRIIYQGTLGTYGQDTVFMTQDDDFYIATELMRDNLLKWKFVIVTESSSRRDPKRSYQFTHLYKGSPKDYAITLGDLQAGYVNLYHDPNNPDKLILENHELKPIGRNDPTYFPASNWMAAFAQDDQSDYIVQALNSPNPYFQAQARRKLRDLPEETLKDLLKRDDLTETARQQISSELKQRSSR